MGNALHAWSPLLLCGAVLLESPSMAQEQCDPLYMTSALGSTSNLGNAVDIDGDTAVVGAWGDPYLGIWTGSVIVFVRSNGEWIQEARLLEPNAVAGQRFGNAVAIDGDTIAVGTVSSNGSIPVIYIFTRNAGVWSYDTTISNMATISGEAFQSEIALDGDTLVAGVEFAAGAGSGQGLVYVYVRTAGVWTQQDILAASDGENFAHFGERVDIDGDTIIVGAPDENNTQVGDRGSAYIFTRSAGVWTQQQKLIASIGGANDHFGSSVSISGDTAIVGAPEQDVTISNEGAAFVFVRNGGVWTEQDRLLAPGASSEDRFGYSVAIEGDLAIVGAYLKSAAYAFQRNGSAWSSVFEISRPSSERLGYSAAISGLTGLAGAPTTSSVGGAYAINLDAECLQTCPGDVDGSLVVDGADLAILLASWGDPGPVDFTGDNTTDGADLAVLLAAWGTCL